MMAHLLITITTIDIGACGNDKDAWGRIGTHDGAPPQVSQPLGGGYVVIIAGGVLVRGACGIPHWLWGHRSGQGARGLGCTRIGGRTVEIVAVPRGYIILERQALVSPHSFVHAQARAGSP